MNNDLEDLAEKAVAFSQERGCNYCDIRAESTIRNGISIENGQIEFSNLQIDRGIGIRVLNSGFWGFYSISNPNSNDEVKLAVEQAVKNSHQGIEKKQNKIKLAEVPSYQDKISFPVLVKPTIEDLIQIGFECDKEIQNKKRIIKSQVDISYETTRKYFVSSEGSKINQENTDVVADLIATAHESGLTESVNITEGGRGGTEVITKNKDIVQVAEFVAQKASELIDAKPAKEDKTTIVMNPDFVSLLTHEILGHPSEADRVLGKEMAWAGGSWWAGKLGEKIGSDNLNVFDDPTIEGSLGHYKYDDEGVVASRNSLIEEGVLLGHLQNRETSQIFNAPPSANMRATSYKFMPLIRMACTCIASGEWDPQEMIKDVKEGYLVSNMKIPSIDMKRYNWSISCQFAQKIENGELTQLLRDVIVMGTAPEFFSSINACGNDFTVRPITNCGKGDPMQSMIMGNGGPSIRATATVKSVGAN